MIRVVGRLLVALAVAFPVTLALAAGADGATPNASGPAVQHCAHWEDSMRISPGIGLNPASQSVVAHGRLWGCTKGGGGAQYSSTMQMPHASCGDLAMSGTASFDWADGSHSTAFLQFNPQALEPNKVSVSGSMMSGMFQGLAIRAWLRFTQFYNGTGAQCSPTNLLRHIDFTNTQSFQLLTPRVTTTTQGPPISRPRTTTPATPPPTVPVTNFIGPPPPPPAPPPNNPPPVRVVFRGGGGGGFVAQSFPQGTLAFTGSSSRLAAMLGLEAMLIGGALACLDPERRRRRLARFANLRRRPKSFLQVTLPPMR